MMLASRRARTLLQAYLYLCLQIFWRFRGWVITTIGAEGPWSTLCDRHDWVTKTGGVNARQFNRTTWKHCPWPLHSDGPPRFGAAHCGVKRDVTISIRVMRGTERDAGPDREDRAAGRSANLSIFWSRKDFNGPASRESPVPEHLTNKETGPCCKRVARNKWQ